MLSTNDQRASMLARLLKKQKIPAVQACVGDVVVHDFGVYEVVRIACSVLVFVEESDPVGVVLDERGHVVLIVDRGCLDRRG